VLKRTIAEELTNAIRTVQNGGTYLDPAVAGAVVGGYVNPPLRLKARAN
jgi:DNA-binding NarL/FixJ family response regulator